MKYKKITAFLLSIAMMVGMIPAAAFADNEEQVDETISEQQEIEEQEDSQDEDTQESEIALNDDEGEPEIESAAEADLQNEPDEVISGPAGENATWTLDSSGTLVISGTGDIDKQTLSSDPAWTSDVWNSIGSIRIEEGITGIGEFSLWCLDYLRSVSISSTVTHIDQDAFGYCGRLAQVIFAENSSLTVIGNSAFDRCSMLRSFYVPSSVTSIGDHAFYGCQSLKTVVFGENCKLETIEKSTFEKCTKLADITLPATVKWISKNAFYNCVSLASFRLPDSITGIDSDAFKGCDNLAFVYCSQFPYDIEYWKEGSFKDERATYCIVPGDFYWDYSERFDGVNITFISEDDIGECGENARWLYDEDDKILYIIGTGDMYDYAENEHGWNRWDEEIKKVMIVDDITSIGDHAFSNLTELEEVEITDNSKITSIGDSAFDSCHNLKSIAIPSGVTQIKGSAFRACSSLTAVTIPENVTFIGYDAFVECGGIDNVYVYADPDKLTWDDGYCNDFKVDYTTICHVNKDDYFTFRSKFGTTVNVTFEGNLVGTGSGVVLRGYSLTLTGEIGVNFYIELDDDLCFSDWDFMQFTLADGTIKKTALYYAGKDTSVIPGKTLYVFQCKVAAKDVGSKLKAQMYLSGKPCGDEYTYSAGEYIDYLRANSGRYDYETNNLADAIYNYCTYAQIYFNKETSAVPDESKISGVVIDDKYKYDGNANLPEGVTFVGSSLSLKSGTTMSLYFKNTSGVDLSFDYYGYNIEPEKTGGYVIVRLTDIPAQYLNLKLHFTINDNYSIDYCPLSYCYRVLNGGSDDVKLQNVCKALYNYHKAAFDYAETHKDDSE